MNNGVVIVAPSKYPKAVGLHLKISKCKDFLIRLAIKSTCYVVHIDFHAHLLGRVILRPVTRGSASTSRTQLAL